MLKRVDFVVLCCPLSPTTDKIINAQSLAVMKPTACVVNVARGGVVDTEALADALSAGTIGSAGLDVTDPEPLPQARPSHCPPPLPLLAAVLSPPMTCHVSESDAALLLAPSSPLSLFRPKRLARVGGWGGEGGSINTAVSGPWPPRGTRCSRCRTWCWPRTAGPPRPGPGRRWPG